MNVSINRISIRFIQMNIWNPAIQLRKIVQIEILIGISCHLIKLNSGKIAYLMKFTT